MILNPKFDVGPLHGFAVIGLFEKVTHPQWQKTQWERGGGLGVKRILVGLRLGSRYCELHVMWCWYWKK